MGDSADKLAYFQAITGLDDPDLCTEILSAHGWDLELAISSITSTANPDDNDHQPDQSSPGGYDSVPNERFSFREVAAPPAPAAGQPGLVWKVVTLPISIISGSLGLVSGAIGLGFWVAGGVLSYSLGMVGLGSGRGGESSARDPLASVSAAVAEATEFVASFERDFGRIRPRFVTEGFMDALQRSRREFKLMFVYLHSRDHPDTQEFCSRTLGNETLVDFVNENFIAWGGSIRASEGFKMSNSLKASRYPFCAVVMAATNQRIALLLQIEGPRSPEQMINLMQRVLEESASVLTTARLDAEERLNNMRLREEQDAAYRAALEADQAREQQRIEELERLEREAAEAERKRKEEEEALERAAREAAEKEIALAKLREEKALSLGTEPEKGPDVTQVLVRFPTGERKARRFQCSAPVQSVYDYVDSLGCLKMDSYLLASNFPRTVYGPETLSKSLKEAGLHPQAGLFVEQKHD